jgi:hypothetical protein
MRRVVSLNHLWITSDRSTKADASHSMDCGINPDLRLGIRSQSLLSGRAMIGVHGDHNAMPMAYMMGQQGTINTFLPRCRK